MLSGSSSMALDRSSTRLFEIAHVFEYEGAFAVQFHVVGPEFYGAGEVLQGQIILADFVVHQRSVEVEVGVVGVE